jgi:AraC-like DNA-binding protein
MKSVGNKKPKDAVTPSLRLAAARMLEAALASTGVSIREPSESKHGVRLTWPKGPSLTMTFVFDNPTSGIADYHNASESKGQKVIHVLRSASPGMRDELRLRGLNFVDVGTGAVRFTGRGLVIDRNDLGRTHRASHQVDQRSPFSDRASLIPRVLLSSPQSTWKLSDLAAHAGVSRALVSRVVNALDEENLIDSQKDGRELRVTLRDPWPLFLRWVGEYRWSDNPAVTVAAPVGSMQRFLYRIQEEFSAVPDPRRWALTLQAAAAQLAPNAKWDVIQLYVDCRTRSELVQFANALKWQPSRQGKVTLLAPRYRRATWWRLQEHHELPIVHQIQLLLDLWHYPIRGREQAEYLARKLGWPPLPA